MLNSLRSIFGRMTGRKESQVYRLSPISREEFRLQLRKTFILHGAVMGPGVLVSILANYLQLLELQIITMAVLAVLIAVIDFFFWKPPNFNGRMLDIYPEIKLKNHFLSYMLLYCPITSLFFVLFLSFKDRNPEGRTPFLLGRGRPLLYGILSILLFGPFFWSGLILQDKVEIEGVRKISYWVSSPTGDQLIWIGDQILANKRLESSLRNSSLENTNETFREFNEGNNLNNIGAIISLAHSFTKNYPNDGKITSEEKQKRAMNILLDFKCIVDQNFHSSHLGRVNPLALINPYTAYEAVLLGLVNSIIDYNFASRAVDLKEQIIKSIKKNNSSEQQNETTKIQNKLRKHRIYRTFEKKKT